MQQSQIAVVWEFRRGREGDLQCDDDDDDDPMVYQFPQWKPLRSATYRSTIHHAPMSSSPQFRARHFLEGATVKNYSPNQATELKVKTKVVFSLAEQPRFNQDPAETENWTCFEEIFLHDFCLMQVSMQRTTDRANSYLIING
jgi:hypothetical protein